MVAPSIITARQARVLRFIRDKEHHIASVLENGRTAYSSDSKKWDGFRLSGYGTRITMAKGVWSSVAKFTRPAKSHKSLGMYELTPAGHRALLAYDEAEALAKDQVRIAKQLETAG